MNSIDFKKSLIDNLKKENFSLIRDVEVYFKINHPILFSFRSNDDTYLGYMTKYKPVKGKIEYLAVNSSEREILEILTLENSIYDAFMRKDTETLFYKEKRNRKTREREYVLEIYDSEDKIRIEGQLPKKDFKLKPIYPNDVNLQEVKNNLIKKIDKNKSRIYISRKEDKIEVKEKEIFKRNFQKSFNNYYKTISEAKFEKIVEPKIKEMIEISSYNYKINKDDELNGSDIIDITLSRI